MFMNIDKLSRSDLFNIPSTCLYLTEENFKMFDKSFRIILTVKIEMIKNNEDKNISTNRKRRIERKIKMDDKMKSLLNKTKSEKKKKKNTDKT